MAGVRISALPSIAVPATSDIFPVVQAGVTYKETMAQLQTLFGFPSGVLSMSAGGTGANLTPALGSVPYSTASAFGLVAPGTSGQLFQSAGAASPDWTTATYPSIAGTSGSVIVSDGTNFTSSTVTGITALGAQAQALNMNSHLINNVLTPVSPNDAANKSYVDSIATGGGAPVVAATTGALTVTQSGAGVGATLTNAGAQATFTLDGQTPAVGSRVLVKNQSGGSNTQNGVYTVTNAGSVITNWVLTRATDYDTPADINDTGVIPVSTGTVNANTGWINTTTMITVDTTPITFVQFGNTGTVSSVTFTGDGTVLSSTPSGAVTTTGTLTASLKTQTANTIFSGPSTGSAATPTFRSLVPADIASAITSGTFTPVLSPSSGTFTTVTYSSQQGEYTQIGNLVFYGINIVLSAFSIGTGSGNLEINGLPVSAVGGPFSEGTVLLSNVTYSGNSIVAQIGGGTSLNILTSTSGSGAFVLAVSGLSSTSTIRIFGFYFTT